MFYSHCIYVFILLIWMYVVIVNKFKGLALNFNLNIPPVYYNLKFKRYLCIVFRLYLVYYWVYTNIYIQILYTINNKLVYNNFICKPQYTVVFVSLEREHALAIDEPHLEHFLRYPSVLRIAQIREASRFYLSAKEKS